jgi:molybdopterin/thiamine biosynthesis adenylyltransferase
MAAANFFDRALLSASQALRGIEPAAIQDRLESQVVELAFDAGAAAAPEGRMSLDLAVRLFARLYPTLRLTDLDENAAALKVELEKLARAINPAIELSSSEATTVRLVYGATATEEGPTVIYAGSDGWLTKISTTGPQGVGGSNLPFGAGGAACLGAANVFRAIFKDALEVPRLDEEVVLSLLDFTTGADATQGPRDVDVDIGSTPLVGVGAIGNAAIWALARTPGLTGSLQLIDHEPVDLSNLQRYVLTIQRDVGRQKVIVAQKAMTAGRSRLRVARFGIRWEEFVARRGHPAIGRVVAALDSAADRIAVQAALPARTLNAWTQAGDLGVSRHGFLGDEACLACLYIPEGKRPNEDQLIAQALGLPIEPQALLHPLRELLVNGQSVGEDFVRDAAKRLGLADDALLTFAGEPLRQFYAKAVCGGVILQAETGRPPLEAPLAFQSALAGVMLAAELVAEAGELRSEAVKTKTIVDLKRPLGRRLNFQVAKPGAAAPTRCICQDPDFIAVYRAKHGLEADVAQVSVGKLSRRSRARRRR